jgi:putative hydrolase of the HAD superfamily
VTITPKPVLLFDLGHVLVEVTGERDIKPYLRKPWQPDATGWPAMEAWEAFEKGLLTPDVFAQQFVEQVDLNIEPSRFIEEFAAWTRGFFPGATEMLAALRPGYRLVALSNSNEVHWARNAALGVSQEFERAFSSHEIGLRKPAAEIFEHVLQAMDLAPHEVTFFDDQQANIDGAKAVGLHAYRVKGLDELRACLRELGCL